LAQHARVAGEGSQKERKRPARNNGQNA
jgi:hypothetical protein